MTTEDNELFDRASPETLHRLLRRRGVFINKDTPKEELRRLFGIAFSYQEYRELSNSLTQ